MLFIYLIFNTHQTKFVLMKKIYLFLLIASVSLTSCLNILEEIVLNRDGSGQYKYTVDMGSIFENEFIKNAFEADPGASDLMKDKDSTIYGKDMPEADKAGNPDLWNRVVTRFQTNEAQKKFIISISLPFKNPEEINYLLKNMSTAMASADTAASFNSGMTEGMSTAIVNYGLGKKTIIRNTVPAANPEKVEPGMAELLFADASYKVVYRLPGKVKKTSIKDAVIKGNTVETSMPMADMMGSKFKIDGSIRYK